MRAIVEAAGIEAGGPGEPGELVLEVGPGTGGLSELLLEAGTTWVGVEVDRQLEPILRGQLEPFGDRATLMFTSILAGKHELDPEVAALLGDRPFKLIANLPYQIASPLLANLVLDYPGMSRAVIMVQREVADRLTAAPGGKDFGPLGILIQAFCHTQRVATLGPSCFWPQPKVASAVIVIERREQAPTDDPHRLTAMIQRLFSRRRKQLGTILGQGAVLPEGVNPQMRPEMLTVEQIIFLAAHNDG